MVKLPRRAVASPLLHACVTLLFCLLLLFRFGDVWHMADLRLYDFLAAARAEATCSPQVAILDIDDRTLSSVGQWPWPRYRIGALLDVLQGGHPALLDVDVLFPEEDRTSLSVIRETFRREFGLDIAFTGIPEGLTDNDGYLAEILGNLPAVGAVFFLADAYNKEQDALPDPVRVKNGHRLDGIPQAAGLIGNIPTLQKSMAASGFINAIPDEDGVLRRFFLLYGYKGRLYPHIWLASLMQMLKTRELRVEKTFWGYDLCLTNGEGDCSLRLPVQRDGSILLRFGAGEACPTVPALDMLRGDIPPETFAGKIVILGASAAGLKDLHHTPTASGYAGSQIQATFFDNALNRAFHIWPDWANLYGLGATLLSGVAVTLLFILAPPLYAGLGSAAVLLAGLGLTAVFFVTCGVFLPAAAAGLTTLLLMLVLSLELYAREHKKTMEQLRSVVRTRQLTLESMAAVAEMRTVENDGHIRRTQEYVRILANRLRKGDAFPELTSDAVDLLYHSAPLHDLGKVAIPDSILFKPGPLTPEEFAVMKTHTTYGKSVIDTAGQSLDHDHFLLTAAEIAISHHEKWDGTGYPRGLSGNDIPLSGRIMALADVYDALVSKRVYKEAFTHDKTRRIIIEGRGSHFDPRIVDAFLAEEAAFIACAQKQTG